MIPEEHVSAERQRGGPSVVRPEVVHRPDSALASGYGRMLADISKELYQARWLTYQLFRRELLGAHKQSFLGVLWLVAPPVITMGSFILLAETGVIAVGAVAVPYALYALSSIAIWQIFARGVLSGSGALVGLGEVLGQAQFSRKSVVFAFMAQGLVSSCVLMLGVFVLGASYVVAGSYALPGPLALLFPLSLLPLSLLSLGFAFFFGVLNAIARDFSSVLSPALTFLLFVTPIVYEPPSGSAGVFTDLQLLLSTYNPLYYLVVSPRDLLLHGVWEHGLGYALSLGFSVLVFGAGMVVFHLSETRVAERV